MADSRSAQIAKRIARWRLEWYGRNPHLTDYVDTYVPGDRAVHLMTMQNLLAREMGFADWAEFKRSSESRKRSGLDRALSFR